MDLAGARKVYIPINHQQGGCGTHWSLCVADMEEKVAIKRGCVMEYASFTFLGKLNVQLDKMYYLDHDHFIYASYTRVQHNRVNRQTR